jgi:hypothetical protein
MKLTTTKTPVTAKERVLKTLNSGKWIDRFTIEDDNIGGVGGMRRLRELRASGLNIVKRAHPEYLHEFQYRLVKK